MRPPAGKEPRRPKPAAARQPESVPKGASPGQTRPRSAKRVAPRSNTSRSGQPR